MMAADAVAEDDPTVVEQSVPGEAALLLLGSKAEQERPNECAPEEALDDPGDQVVGMGRSANIDPHGSARGGAHCNGVRSAAQDDTLVRKGGADEAMLPRDSKDEGEAGGERQHHVARGEVDTGGPAALDFAVPAPLNQSLRVPRRIRLRGKAPPPRPAPFSSLLNPVLHAPSVGLMLPPAARPPPAPEPQPALQPPPQPDLQFGTLGTPPISHICRLCAKQLRRAGLAADFGVHLCRDLRLTCFHRSRGSHLVRNLREDKKRSRCSKTIRHQG